MTTKTHDAATVKDHLDILQGFADAYIARGDRDECDKAGKNLATMVTQPEYAYMANGLAAILEGFRRDYTKAFLMDAVRANLRAQEARVPAPAGVVPTGTFTVVFGDDDYRTIEIEVADWADGKIVASYLSGPDNETSFTGFAFIDPQTHRISVWKRFRDGDSRIVDAVRVILGADKDEQMDLAEAYALRSGRCARCHHKLTVPASLHRGYGPDCAAKLGLV